MISLGGLGLIGGNAPERVAAGTPVLWPDGSEAGKVAFDHVTPNNLSDHGTLRCWQEKVTGGSRDEIRLCIDPAKVTLPPPPSRSDPTEDPLPPKPTRTDYERLLADSFGIKGMRTRDNVNATITARLRAIHGCFAKAALDDAGLRGKVEIQFEIRPSGKVRDAKAIRTTLADESVGKCVAKIVGKLDFGKGPKSMLVYPFEFRAD